jgi:hypothetical protein
MSTVFTKLYDSSAITRPVASNVIPTQDSTGATATTVRHDQLVPMTGRYRVCTLSGNLGTLSSLGTDTAGVNGTVWFADVFIPFVGTFTGVGVLNGGTVATDKIIVGLHDSSGVLLANSALAGTNMASTNVFQETAFTATYTTLRPGRFWISVQTNGANANIRTIATATWIDVLTNNVAGTFGTVPTLTPATSFAAGKGPIAYLY